MFRSRNIINARVIKVKTDKLMKKALRHAKKQIRKGVLVDSHTFGMYLSSIDDRCDFITTNISIATRVRNYRIVRAARIAEARQLIAFYDDDFAELKSLYRVVARKASEAGRDDDLRQDGVAPQNMEKLKSALSTLTDDDEFISSTRENKQSNKEKIHVS